ncbi:hypothetical protein P4571_08155 [Niallia alba]|uniref:hypothetical protein n=1 Tax=Niallia alba TaxID=2729105 RepID=UPI002E1E1DB9|nr:hypothetical protein [Niallia alba]
MLKQDSMLVSKLVKVMKISEKEANNAINYMRHRLHCDNELIYKLEELRKTHNQIENRQESEKYLLNMFGHYHLTKGKILLNELEDVI